MHRREPLTAAVLPESRSHELLVWSIVGALVAAYVLHALSLRHDFLGNACDDAFISFRYIDVFVDHGELAYNPGERVEGFSNLLWMLLLMPAALAGLDLVLSSQVLGLAFGSAGILVAVRGLRTVFGIKGAVPACTVAGALAASGYYAGWSVLGMESMLHAFLLLAAWIRYQVEDRRGGFPVSAVLLGLLAATRPEGLVFAVVAACAHGYRCSRGRRSSAGAPGWWFFVALAIPVIAFEAFRLGYYEGLHLWPNSVRAKLLGGSLQWTRGLRYLADNFLSPYWPLLTSVAVLWWYRRDFALVSGLALFGMGLGVVVASGGDWSQGRFFAPLLPIGVVVFTATLCRVLERSGVRRTWQAMALAVVALVGALGNSYHVTSTSRTRNFVRRFAAVDARRVEQGRWLADHSAEDTVVALCAAGQIAYYSKRRAHDMFGLNDSHIGNMVIEDPGRRRVGHEKFDIDYTLNEVRPTVIVGPAFMPGMLYHPTFKARYRKLDQFDNMWVSDDFSTQ